MIYVEGNALYPQGGGTKIIAHICNNLNAWGAGFVVNLSRRWKLPEQIYRRLAEKGLRLGDVQFVPVEQDEQGATTTIVANMIAQKGYGKNNKNLHRTSEVDSEIPLQYSALEECLLRVAEVAKLLNASVHCPRIGAGLGGGSWKEIEEILQRTLSEQGISVTIYTRPGDKFNP